MAGRSTLVLALVLLIAGGAAYKMHWDADAAIPNKAAPAQRGAPVQVAAVRRENVPVTLSGLGTVQPLNVVTVTSRVDGAITQIGFEEGQMVKEGDLLAQIDPRPFQASLDQVKAKQEQDEAQLANAERDLVRYSQLAQSNFASRQQLDSQKATVAQLKAAIAGDKAAVESAQVQLDYATIRSPIAGRTGFRLVDKGNLVRATDAAGIVTVSQIAPITALFTLPERDFPEVAAAMKRGAVPAVAVAPGGKDLESGSLTVLNSQIDQTSGTFKAKATFPNEDGALWPGQSVTIRLLVRTLDDVVTVPEDALQRGPDGYFAFVVSDDSKAQRRPLVVSHQGPDAAVIDKGLAEGDRVVIAGGSRVDDGSEVEVADTRAETKPAVDADKAP